MLQKICEERRDWRPANNLDETSTCSKSQQLAVMNVQSDVLQDHEVVVQLLAHGVDRASHLPRLSSVSEHTRESHR